MLILENESGSLQMVHDRSEAFQLQREDVARGELRARIRREEHDLQTAEERIDAECRPSRRGVREILGDILGFVLRG